MMDTSTLILVTSLILLFCAYFLLDVSYFIRSAYVTIRAKYISAKLDFLQTSTMYGLVLPSDADGYITHMNDSRVFRELDFARMEFFERTGLIKMFWVDKQGGFVKSQNCRYRQPLGMLSIYRIDTRIIYYDSNTIYLEQKVITLFDNETRCIANVSVDVKEDFEQTVQTKFPEVVMKPKKIPKYLEALVAYNHLSSENLRDAEHLEVMSNTNKFSRV